MKSYTLQSSTDGTTWTGYEENGQVKVVEVKGCIYINGLAHYFKKEKCFCREFFLNIGPIYRKFVVFDVLCCGKN